MDRKAFIKSGLTIGASSILLPGMAHDFIQEDPDPLKKSLVKEFVLAGHFDLDKTKSMLGDYPNLIYAKHDWGNGDFEEAIEGAGHKANKEIAEYLISQGARVNLFVLTMLGKTDLVKPMLEAYPNLIFSKGAHGLTLLHHAEIGGDYSKELKDYLISQGLSESKMQLR